jgi:hypothetical protein
MNMNLAPFCVYTIVHVTELRRVHDEGGKGTFTENKKWVRGAQLFREAGAAGQRMPVVFADAATTAGLIYYALLTDVTVLGDSVRGPTRYSFEGLTPIHPPVPKSALIKLTGSEPLDDNYIRPYVLCHTPAFLLSSAKARPAQQPVAQSTGAPQARSRAEKATIYLFGYSGKTLEQIAQALGEDGLLIDIRYSPRSRKAGFSRSGLERVFGERYRHVRELGNADYQTGGIRLADAEAGVQIIETLIAEQNSPLFLMCSCEDGATCHRREVGKLLKKRGHSVTEYAFA